MWFRSSLFPLLLFPSLLAWGQVPGTFASDNQGPTQTNQPTSTFIQGKVTVENGSEPTQIAILMDCTGQTYSEGFADSKGNFSFELNRGTSREMVPMAEVGTMLSAPFANSSPGLGDCNLRAQAPGYTSSSLSLVNYSRGGLINVGQIILHSLATAEATPSGRGVVTFSQLQIPRKASAEFKKGMQEEQKHKFDRASVHFQRAIRDYPRYALAWAQLGEVQQKSGNVAEAYSSFLHAVQYDPNLVVAYRGLALIEGRAQQWGLLLHTTGRVLEIYPRAYADFWFLHAVAQFNLKKLQSAEQSILRGLQLDPKHQIPQMEYLCGRVLGEQGNYEDAARHIRRYLKLVPHAPDAPQAHSYLVAYENSTDQRAEK